MRFIFLLLVFIPLMSNEAVTDWTNGYEIYRCPKGVKPPDAKCEKILPAPKQD